MRCLRRRKIGIGIFFIQKNALRCMLAVGLLTFIAFIMAGEAEGSFGNADFDKAWLCTFWGSREMGSSQEEVFQLPVLWFVFHAFILYMLCDFLSDSGRGVGMQMFLREKSKKRQMLHLSAFCVGIVCGYYIFYFALLQMICIIRANHFKLFLQESIEKTILLYLLPPVVSASMLLVQNVIGLFIKDYVSYMISIVLLILSAYFKNPFLIGNYAMYQRIFPNEEDGVNGMSGMVICLIISVAALIAAMIQTERIDFVGKEREEG